MATYQLLFITAIFLTNCEAGKQRSGLKDLSQRVYEIERLFQEQINQTTVEKVPETMPCPAGFFEHKPLKTCYRTIEDKKSWYEAREDCQTQGARLLWFESISEYRRIAIKLLSEITAEKDFNNVGYWSGANDIIKGPLVWGDTDQYVQSYFFETSSSSSSRNSYSRSQSSSSSTTPKHCVFMKYDRETMRLKTEISECDGGRMYICKCRRDTDDGDACITQRVTNSDD